MCDEVYIYNHSPLLVCLFLLLINNVFHSGCSEFPYLLFAAYVFHSLASNHLCIPRTPLEREWADERQWEITVYDPTWSIAAISVSF